MSELLKKFTLTTYVQVGTLVVSLIAFIIYLVNSFTGYLADAGVRPFVILLSIIALVLLVANILVGDKLGKYQGYVTMVIGVLLAVCAMCYLSEKVDVIGDAFFIPVNHADSEIAAAKTAIVGVVFYIIAFLAQTVATFMDGGKKA